MTGDRFLGSEGQTSNFSAWAGTPTQQTSDLKARDSALASHWLMPPILASDWPRETPGLMSLCEGIHQKYSLDWKLVLNGATVNDSGEEKKVPIIEMEN